METLIEVHMALTFKSIHEFQKSWKDTPPYTEQYHYARLLTHISKNITAELASCVSKMAMEIYGGIGFLEEFPIERLHREALITPIWEGTSNIQALEMLETIVKKGAHLYLLKDIGMLVNEIEDEIVSSTFNYIKNTLSDLLANNGLEMQFYSKEVLSTIGHGISVILLSHMGYKLGINRFNILSRIYYEKFLKNKSIPRDVLSKIRKIINIEEIGD